MTAFWTISAALAALALVLLLRPLLFPWNAGEVRREDANVSIY